MKFANIMIAFLAAGITSSAAASLSSYALDAEKSWQESYLEVIENYNPETHPDATFELFYIDEDDIPELYVETGYFSEGVLLYTYFDEEAVLCLEESYRASLWFPSAKNGYFSKSGVASAGLETYYDIMRLENGECITEYTFYHDGREETDDIYMINDEEVTQEEFENKEAALKAEYSLITDYENPDPVVSYSYEEIRQYLLGSDEQDTTEAVSTEETIINTTAQTADTTTSAAETTAESTASGTTTTALSNSSNSTSASPDTGQGAMSAVMLAGMTAFAGVLLCRRRK